VILAAVGGDSDLDRALLAQGVNAVGGALGDLIPAQVGTTDGAFTLAAPLLGLAASASIAIAVLVHLIQAFGAIAGVVAALAWRRRQCPCPTTTFPPSAGSA
jgi:hypothetical protein